MAEGDSSGVVVGDLCCILTRLYAEECTADSTELYCLMSAPVNLCCPVECSIGCSNETVDECYFGLDVGLDVTLDVNLVVNFCFCCVFVEATV